MESLRYLIVPLIALAWGCASTPSLRSELREFKFQGKPISPAAVHALLTEWSDLAPAHAAMDLEGFTESEVHNSAFEERDGFASYRPGEERYQYPGLFKYRHLGVSKSGVHILEWFDNGGGTLTIYGALLVRFDEDRVIDCGKTRRRVLMVSVGEIWDPDKTGTFRFDGRRLTGRDASDPDYRIDIIID